MCHADIQTVELAILHWTRQNFPFSDVFTLGGHGSSRVTFWYPGIELQYTSNTEAALHSMSLSDSVHSLHQDVSYLQHITSFNVPRVIVTLFTPAPPSLLRCAWNLLMVNSIIQKSLVPNFTQSRQEVWDARILKPTGYVMNQQV